MLHSLKKMAFSSHYIAILLFSNFAATAAETNEISGIPSGFVLPRLVWGEATNGIRAGVTDGDPQIKGIAVFIVGQNKNSSIVVGTNKDSQYLTSPNFRFSRVELRDTNGMVISPLKGRKLDGDLPQQILVKDLPRLPDWGTEQRGSIGGLRDWLHGNPATLKVFSIQDVYPIKKDGDYILTVCPVIYEYVEDRPFVSRLDLPCVTTKVHLVPTR